MSLRVPAELWKSERDLAAWCRVADYLGTYTVATLPIVNPKPKIGDSAIVSDATAPTWNAALTGGGAVVCRAFYNGSAWRAG